MQTRVMRVTLTTPCHVRISLTSKWASSSRRFVRCVSALVTPARELRFDRVAPIMGFTPGETLFKGGV